MIHVIATIKAKENQRSSLVAAFRETVQTVKAKNGCVEYALAIHLNSDLPGQIPFDENELIIVEKWTSLESFKEHLSDPAFRGWYVNVWPLIAGASMQILEAA